MSFLHPYSLCMDIQIQIEKWRNDSLKKSSQVGNFFVCSAAEFGFALSVIVGVVETVVRGIFTAIPLCGHSFFDPLTTRDLYDKTSRGAILSFAYTLNGALSLGINWNWNQPMSAKKQIVWHLPVLTRSCLSLFVPRFKEPLLEETFAYQLLQFSYIYGREPIDQKIQFPLQVFGRKAMQTLWYVSAIFVAVIELFGRLLETVFSLQWTKKHSFHFIRASFQAVVLSSLMAYHNLHKSNCRLTDIRKYYSIAV